MGYHFFLKTVGNNIEATSSLPSNISIKHEEQTKESKSNNHNVGK